MGVEFWFVTGMAAPELLQLGSVAQCVKKFLAPGSNGARRPRMQLHDAVYHDLVTNPELAGEIFLEIDAPWKVDVDVETIEYLSPKLRTPNLGLRIGDLIFRVRFRDKGKESYLCVSIEVQSNPVRLMGARGGGYICALHLALQEKHLVDGKNPPAVSVVLYRGEYRWTGKHDLHSQIALSEGHPLWSDQCQQRFWVVDLRRYSAEWAIQCNKAFSVLVLVEQVNNADKLNTARDVLQSVLRQPYTRKLKNALVVFFLAAFSQPGTRMLTEADVENLLLEELQVMLAENVERLHESMREVGRKEARREAQEAVARAEKEKQEALQRERQRSEKEKGKLELALQMAVVSVLQARFGSLGNRFWDDFLAHGKQALDWEHVLAVINRAKTIDDLNILKPGRR